MDPPFGYESDVEDSFSEYKRSVRGRAQTTINELQRSLRSSPAVTPERRRNRRSRSESPTQSYGRPPSRSPSPRALSPLGHRSSTRRYRRYEESASWASTQPPIEHSDYTYGAAVDRLRDLLNKHEPRPSLPKSVQFTSRPNTYSIHDFLGGQPNKFSFPGVSRGIRGEVPGPEETVPLLQNQSGVVTQLEAENRYLRDELQALKGKVKEIIEENKLLHEEIKRSAVHEILKQGLDVDGIPRNVVEDVQRTAPPFAVGTPDQPFTKQDYMSWHKELERINTLHAVKASRLEAQLTNAREDVEKYEKEIHELSAKLRLQNAYSTVDETTAAMTSGLCIRCAQSEAVLPASYGSQKQTIDKLNRERDELVDRITGMKAKLSESQHREEEAYQQVKRSVQMVEQAQLEQTQALVQREQLKEELEGMRRRMEQHAEEMSAKMAEEREIVRKENKLERDDLNSKLKEVQEQLTETELQLDRVTRDKVMLMTEVQNVKGHLSSSTVEYGQATDSYKLGVTQASLERDKAVRELARLKRELEQEESDREHERHRLKVEIEDLRRRLFKAEKELVESKEECIHLTTNSQALEREAHLAKLAKESIEKNRSDDVKSIMARADNREQELNMIIDTMENKHAQAVGEFEDILSSQSNLVQKLREECRHVASQLEKVQTKYKNDNKHLKNTVEQLKVRLNKAQKRGGELEDGNKSHAHLHDKMRQRLRQMDEHSQHQAQQILELLAKESSLMRDRQVLSREVEFLRQQITVTNDTDLDKQNIMHSSRHVAVQDIINNVKHEDESSKRDLLESDIPQMDIPVLDGDFDQDISIP